MWEGASGVVVLLRQDAWHLGMGLVKLETKPKPTNTTKHQNNNPPLNTQLNLNFRYAMKNFGISMSYTTLEMY